MYHNETYLSELRETLLHERAYLWRREEEIEAEHAAARAEETESEQAVPAN